MNGRAEPSCPGLAAVLPRLEAVAMQLGRTVLVGIGGPGGSGKSTFTAALAGALGGDASVLPLDDYRKPRAERPPGIYGSHPAGNRLDLLTRHLAMARRGETLDRPVFCRHRGAACEVEEVVPGRFLLADGEIAAHRGLRDEFDLRILLHAPWTAQWQARMGRDRRERGCSPGKALALFLRSNLCDYPRHAAGAPSRADLILQRSRAGTIAVVRG